MIKIIKLEYISLTYKNRSAGKIYLSIRYQANQSAHYQQPQSQQVNYSQKNPTTGWGNQPQQNPYGAPNPGNGWGNQSGWGNPPPQNGGWGPQANTGWGQQPQMPPPQQAFSPDNILAQNLLANMGGGKTDQAPSQQSG